MPATSTSSKVPSAATATATTSDSVSIPVDDNERSNPISVDTDSITPIDHDSFVAGAVSESAESTPTPTRVSVDPEYSVILAELIHLVTTQLQSLEFKILDSHSRFQQLYYGESYIPLSTDQINEILSSYRVYRTLDGSFECENNDPEYKWRIPLLINGIVEQYIKASFDSTSLKSEYEAFSKDDIDRSKINEMLGALLTFAPLTSTEMKIVQMLGTLGYHLQNKAAMFNNPLLATTHLYHGYHIALCTTDLIENLDYLTRQKCAYMIMLQYSTSTLALIQLYLKNNLGRYILPVEYQKCYQFQHVAMPPGHLDLYEHGFNWQSETKASITYPHTTGNWTIAKGNTLQPTFISSLCKGCDHCYRNKHPTNLNDPGYKDMLSLVPERGIFKLYTDWRLLMYYVVLVGALTASLYATYNKRLEGVDPGGLTGTIVLIAIASVGFVRELFYPETELRDFLRAKVAISKFSKYCKLKGVCGSCVAALAVKNNADFGPVAVGPFASIAGGKPGPAERGKIFMDEPCDIKCFYATGFALTPNIQVFSDGFGSDVDGATRITKMEWPPVFEQLIKYVGRDCYSTINVTDYFIVGVNDNKDHNVVTLVHGVATIKKDQIIRIEWFPIPFNAVAL